MKKQIVILLMALLPMVVLAQTKTSKYSNEGDSVQRVIENTNASGITKFVMVTGTDSVTLRAEKDTLNIVAPVLQHNGEPIQSG